MMTRKPKSKVALLTLACGMALACGALGFASRQLLSKSTGLCHGVSIGGIDVGGLSRVQAEHEVLESLSGQGAYKIQLVADDREFTVTAEQLGLRRDVGEAVRTAEQVGNSGNVLHRALARVVALSKGITIPLGYSLDRDRAKKQLSAIAERVDVEPENARAFWIGSSDVDPKGFVRIAPEKPGRKMDVDGVLASLGKQLAASKLPSKVMLLVREAAPDVSRADLRDLNGVLSRYTTSFDPGKRNRAHNLRLSAASIDHQFLRPGETFSYNRCVGPRLEKIGYLPAPIFSDDEVVQGVGGGVCQVATTLYNAALLAGLDIVTRAHHSRPVAYAPRGRDATVYFGNTDLKFRNSTAGPIYLRAFVSGRRVLVKLLGNRSQRKSVTLECARDDRIPFSVEHIEDPTLPEGKEVVEEKGRPGYQTTILRVIESASGKRASETVSSNFYRPRPQKIRVGSGLVTETVHTTPTQRSEPGTGSKSETELPREASGGRTESKAKSGASTSPSQPRALRVVDLGKQPVVRRGSPPR
ncbi:MAG: VanW family protein [Armatimonadetes bacterium]|nr:VanW family protein [Armatimonadota bacterium]